MNGYEERNLRTEWFREARFGLFIHFGLYSIPARGEWVRSIEKISNEDYEKYFDAFNPVDFEPEQWAKLSKKAGMKYAVMTAKHHDGFCLFDSALTDYKSTNTAAKRDLIREYLDAFRKEGIKVGIYYSLIDWHHEHFPAYGDRQHPMRDNINYKDKTYNFENYLAYMHGQVKELLTHYGKIDVLWFDFSYEDMTGEKWEATKLMKMIRELQPHVIVDNRLGGNIKAENPEVYSGDFASPEQIIPPNGIMNDAGKPLPWEACITLNDHWGYCVSDNQYKTSGQIIHALVECVSKNGNLLLNIGPDAKGNIPKESIQILNEVGDWVNQNSESIYGCGSAGLEKPEWGRYTKNKDTLYAHIYERGIGPINLANQNGKIKYASLLKDNSEIQIATPWNAQDYAQDAFIDFKTAQLPDLIDTVVKIQFKRGD